MSISLTIETDTKTYTMKVESDWSVEGIIKRLGNSDAHLDVNAATLSVIKDGGIFQKLKRSSLVSAFLPSTELYLSVTPPTFDIKIQFKPPPDVEPTLKASDVLEAIGSLVGKTWPFYNVSYTYRPFAIDTPLNPTEHSKVFQAGTEINVEVSTGTEVAAYEGVPSARAGAGRSGWGSWRNIKSRKLKSRKLKSRSVSSKKSRKAVKK